jgi:hypothetical protein
LLTLAVGKSLTAVQQESFATGRLPEAQFAGFDLPVSFFPHCLGQWSRTAFEVKTVDNNAGKLVNYGARYHKGLPISSIAESAVNQVVSIAWRRSSKCKCVGLPLSKVSD